jgi:hypothetical protein
MDACAPPLLRFPCSRPKSRARGAPESPSPSEVASSFEAAIPFRGPWFVVVPPDKNDLKPVAMPSQAPHALSTVSGTTDCIFLSRGWDAIAELQKSFHTAIHSLWKLPAAASDVAHSRRRAREKPRPAPLSAIQRGQIARGAMLRDRHDAGPRPARLCAIEVRRSATGGIGPRRWTCDRFGLIVPVCRFPSTRSCRAPRK